MRLGVRYKEWSRLEPDRRYCLMDTMILLTIYRGFHEITDKVDAVLKDRTLLIIPDVMDEAVRVYEKFDLGNKRTVRSNFASNALMHLTRSGRNLETVRPDLGTDDSAMAKFAEKQYVNEEGESLSLVDCVLLSLVTENPNVDLMTEDKTLLNAVSSECGHEAGKRGHRVMEDYYERRNMTAWFIGKLLNASNRVEWKASRGGTEFHVGDSRIVEIGDSVPPMLEISIRPCGNVILSGPVDDHPDSLGPIAAFYRISGKGGYCPCGDPKGEIFKCACGKMEYGDDLDGGLDEKDTRKFLYKMPAGRRARLLLLVGSFDGFRYAMRGKHKPMYWTFPPRSDNR